MCAFLARVHISPFWRRACAYAHISTCNISNAVFRYIACFSCICTESKNLQHGRGGVRVSNQEHHIYAPI